MKAAAALLKKVKVKVFRDSKLLATCHVQDIQAAIYIKKMFPNYNIEIDYMDKKWIW